MASTTTATDDTNPIDILLMERHLKMLPGFPSTLSADDRELVIRTVPIAMSRRNIRAKILLVTHLLTEYTPLCCPELVDIGLSLRDDLGNEADYYYNTYLMLWGMEMTLVELQDTTSSVLHKPALRQRLTRRMNAIEPLVATEDFYPYPILKKIREWLDANLDTDPMSN